MQELEKYENLSSQANAYIFSANFAADCVKTPCHTASMPAEFCLVIDKIMLENPHTLLMKTGSEYLSDCDICREADIEAHREKLFRLRSEYFEIDEKIKAAEIENKTAAGIYSVYLGQMKSDYEVIPFAGR